MRRPAKSQGHVIAFVHVGFIHFVMKKPMGKTCSKITMDMPAKMLEIKK